MSCPSCNIRLEKVLFHNAEVDYCPKCLGVWFDQDELTWAKDDKDQQLNWVDFDIWRDKVRFKLSKSDKHCPVDRAGLVEISYDDSEVYPVKSAKGGVPPEAGQFNGVKIDFCKNCQGVWLDRGEFKKIMAYLKKKADYEVLQHYTKNLIKQLWEVFTGPQKLREELDDFLMVLKLLNYKFMAQHPHLSKIINEDLPK